jgi:hypothetical protein
VQRQLTLWPEAEDHRQEINIWNNLDPVTKKMVITLLSRLITKAVCPSPQEVDHEH